MKYLILVMFLVLAAPIPITMAGTFGDNAFYDLAEKSRQRNEEAKRRQHEQEMERIQRERLRIEQQQQTQRYMDQYTQ